MDKALAVELCQSLELAQLMDDEEEVALLAEHNPTLLAAYRALMADAQ